MFRLCYGNDLRGLACALGARLARPASADLLVPEVVLVSQAGMRRWLTVELAERLGVLANIDFRLPAEFVWDLLRAVRPELGRRSAFDRHLLRWRLMPLLATYAREPAGAEIARYLDGPDATLKRFQLAGEFAAALERYQAYRRDLLAAWERGADRSNWQAELWRRLVRSSAEPHRAHLLGEFLTHEPSPAALPARLSIFGCLNISPDVLRVFGHIAAHCAVDFYLPTPCAEYWGDVRSVRDRLRARLDAQFAAFDEPDNPLLAAFGRVGRDFVAQVFSYEQVQPAVEREILREPCPATLLGRIQADILHLRSPERDAARPQTPEPADVSLQIHDCHSPLREVQVLHDRLLALFERDATLTPRDIAVMLPDVAAYAPSIEAVFGALPAGDPRRIPFSIADRRAADEHPVVGVFLKLVNLPTSRWGASELLELLAVPAVMRRLALDDADLDRLRIWLRDAGVRWGLDETTRAEAGAGRYRAFSWAEGIERLLMSYASGGDATIADIVPAGGIEGSAANALGQALTALRALERLASVQRSPQTAAEWQREFNRTLAVLLTGDGDNREERRALDAVRGALDALVCDTGEGGCDEALDWRTVRAFLGERLAESLPQQRFLSGGVSFCGMVPLRSIPFRVICVLGLDDAAFPRREPATGISVLERDLRDPARRRLGDRSVREDDRYLFLQLLTAAEDVFYLSYVGREARDGSRREPSVVLTELLDCVCRDYFADEKAARGMLLTQHPLQPFARALFDRVDPRLFSYRNEWRVAAAAEIGSAPLPFTNPAPIASVPAPTRVRLDELIRFWRNPARGFLREGLQIHLDAEDRDAEDEDPLALDRLAASGLKRGLIDALLDGRGMADEPDAALRTRLQLPVGRAGDVAYADAYAVAAPIAQSLAQWRRDNPEYGARTCALALEDGWVLECAWPSLHRGGLLHWTPGELRGRHWLAPWIEYLALVAAGDALGVEVAPVCNVFAWKEGVIRHVLKGIDAAAARAHLRGLLAGYADGRTRPLPFFPDSAWACVEVRAGWKGADDSGEHALKAAQGRFGGNQRQRQRGEGADPWIALAFRDSAPFDDMVLRADFLGLTDTVFGGLVGAIAPEDRR